MADDVKLRLIEIAGEAFATRGFDAVGIREICQKAGANVAAVNYHFGDKRALYVACLRHAQSCRVDELAAPQWPADMPPTEKFHAFVRGMLESKLDSRRPIWHLELMLRELSRPSDACREIVEDYIRPMAEALAEILRELMPGSDWSKQTWLIGFSIVGQVLFYYINQPIVRLLMGEADYHTLSLDDLAEHITQFSLAAIGKAAPVEIDAAPAHLPSTSSATVARSRGNQ